MAYAYVIKKHGKYLTGHSYGSGVGFTHSWTWNPFEARIYLRTPTYVPPQARVEHVRVSDALHAALAQAERE